MKSQIKVTKKRKSQINIYIKIYYISISVPLKFKYISYKINKIIILIYLPKKYYQ